MKQEKEVDWLTKVYRVAKHKTMHYHGKKDQRFQQFCFSQVNHYTTQSRDLSDFKIEDSKEGSNILFKVSVKHPCFISSPEKRPPSYQLANEINTQAIPANFKAIVSLLNDNKDKTGLPQKYSWRLIPNLNQRSFCAVLFINHSLSIIPEVFAPEQDVQDFSDLMRSVKLFCEQYADINYGRTERVFPLARYEIFGALLKNKKDKTAQKIKIVIPLPEFMTPEDLQIVFSGYPYNWLRFSSSATSIFLPIDYDPDADPQCQQKVEELHQAVTRHFSDSPDNAKKVAAAKPMLIQMYNQPTGRKSLYDLISEAFREYQMEFVGVDVVKKILLKSYGLQSAGDLMAKCQEGLCVKIPGGPNGRKIFDAVFSSAQIAAMMPARPGVVWSVRAGMVICTIDEMTTSEQVKFTAICQKYPAKVSLKDNKLILLDQQLDERDIIAIGNEIADQSNCNVETSILMKTINRSK